MPEQEIDIEVIDPNPYQKRQKSQAEVVASIALSIAVDKLIQIPTGRWKGKRFQSAIGHTRTDSFRLLASIQDGLKSKIESPDHKELTAAVRVAVEAGRDFHTMPWIVEDLSDEQMYRYATIENNQRTDLSPIEQMEEMKGWVEFGYTSEKISALYPTNMTASTVRGLLAFDKLYPELKEALHTGKITQGTARLFLSMMKIAPKEKVIDALKAVIKKDGEVLPEDVIERHINNLNNTIRMYSGDGKPTAGYHGWNLDMKKFPNHLLPAMTVQQVGTFEAQLDHLTNPPACTACPFYTKVHGTHFCGMRVCFERKTVAYEEHYVEQASQKTKIAIYEKADGAFRPLSAFEDKHRKFFESRDKGLRLVAKRLINNSVYQSFANLDDDLVVIVATGDLIEKLSGNSGRTQGGKKSEKEKAEMRAMRVYRLRRKELLWEYTAAAKSIFDGIPFEVLKKINGWENILIDDSIPEEYDHPQTGTAAEKLEFQRRALVWRLIKNATSFYARRDMTAILNQFTHITGVKAPKALVKRAQEWDAEIKAAGSVSTATAKGKKA